ncbi:MAG: trigger factor [Bryobacteraceae bacterium]|nr:trigger factor [Bryobacteraceae bacterium]
MALVEGCKHRFEITVPVAEVEQETARVVESLRAKVRLPGFRPGKVPAAMIRAKFPDDVRQGVIEALIPKRVRSTIEQERLAVVGEPHVKDVRFHAGEPLQFTLELETFPEFELGDYLNTTVTYREPVVAEEDVDQRLEALRDQKAQYVNIDPRPAAEGDYAVVSLESRAGVEGKPIRQDELVLHLGDPDTLADFTRNIAGMTPDDEKDFDVAYPEDYAEERLSGKTVRFHLRLKAIRRKELPELNDEFAGELGDYKNVEELRDAVRNMLIADREARARQDSKDELVDRLVEMHDFPVPESMVERQAEASIETRLRELAAQGIDPRMIKLDWEKAKETQRERARRFVKGSLILERIAERESIETMVDELDREVQRIARQRGEPVPAVRRELEQEGHLRTLAHRIRIDKTVTFLFEKARKSAPAENT